MGEISAAERKAMLRGSAIIAMLGSIAGLDITTEQKVVWMEFPGLLTVVQHDRDYTLVEYTRLTHAVLTTCNLHRLSCLRLQQKAVSIPMQAAERAARSSPSTTTS